MQEQTIDLNQLENQFYRSNRGNEATFGMLRQIIEAQIKQIEALKAEIDGLKVGQLQATPAASSPID